MRTPGTAVLAIWRWNIFGLMAGFQSTPVPYRGNAPLVTDLVAGQIKFGFVASAGVIQHVREGRLRGIAISAPQRSHLAPDVPTVAESGYPDFKVETTFVLLAPAGIPEHDCRVARTRSACRAQVARHRGKIPCAGHRQCRLDRRRGEGAHQGRLRAVERRGQDANMQVE